MNMQDIRKRLRDPETRAHAAIEFGDYFRDLCLMFDCEVDTAVNIGATIAKGLNREFEKREQVPA
jgi:hypothetical protein